MPNTCATPGCERPHYAQGKCELCYQRQRRQSPDIRAAHTQTVLRRRAALIAEGLCASCGKAQRSSRSLLCGDCHQKQRVAKAKWRHNRSKHTCSVRGCGHAKIAYGLCSTHYFRRRVRQGLCGYCGSPSPADPVCHPCRQTQNLAENTRAQRRIAAGLCAKCGRLELDTERLCRPCQDRKNLREQRRRERKAAH